MLKFILRRLIALPLVLLGVSFFLFLLASNLPPETRAALYVKDAKQLSSLQEVIDKYDLNAPVLIQYSRWLGKIVKGDLGYSESAGMPVGEAIKSYFPATAQLAVVTIILVLFFGLLFGIISAIYKGRIIDKLLRFVSLSGFSLPLFVLGLILLMVFYGKYHLFSPGEYSLSADLIIHGPGFKSYTGFSLIDALLNLNFYVFFDVLNHLVLPALTLCFGSFALQMQVMRSSLIEELSKDYITAARARGLSETRVILNHAVRNALIPALTLASIQFIRLLGGTVIVETVFDYNGLGRFGVECARQLDIAGILGFSLVVAFLFVFGNLIADILYRVCDPRIRLK